VYSKFIEDNYGPVLGDHDMIDALTITYNECLESNHFGDQQKYTNYKCSTHTLLCVILAFLFLCFGKELFSLLSPLQQMFSFLFFCVFFFRFFVFFGLRENTVCILLQPLYR
jgi:hypothetical protein